MIEIKDLHVSFDGAAHDVKRVLQGLNLVAEGGEFICMLGSNGAGKSTLFNAILGLVPYEGKILLDGKDIKDESTFERCKKIGIVYQDPLKGSAPNLTVAENLILFGPRRVKKKPFLAKCAEELKEYGLGLEDNLKTMVKDLSGGMRQALSLYMATMRKPKLLLLDEHIAALDPATSEIIMAATERIARDQGLTTIMIIHNLKMALSYGNRLLLLDGGEIALDVKGEEKANLTEEKLLQQYSSHLSDRTLFSRG